MSRNYEEYKDNIKPEENQLDEEDDGLVNIDEAKEQVYGEEE